MKHLFLLSFGFLISALGLFPSPFTVTSAETAQPKKKGTNYAFLIACAGYDKAELQPIKDDVTINDIREFKKALLETGFEEANIVVMHDKQTERRFLPMCEMILKELDLFLDDKKPEDTVLLVLSGHGVLFAGEKTGYFCPVDAKISNKTKLIPMDGPKGMYEQLEKCKAGRKLLIANACRNDPISGSSLAGDKIKLVDDYPENVPKGIAALFSCEAGQKSYFDADRKRSLFFIHLTEAWRGNYQPGDGPLTLESVFETTRAKTKADANKTFGEKQYPVVRRQYEGEWVVARDLGSVKEPKAGEEREFEIATGVKMVFCWIPPGESQLGSPKEEQDYITKTFHKGKRLDFLDSETESWRGKFKTKGIWLGKYSVTQAEWKALMGVNPSKFDGKKDNKAKGLDTSRFPVEQVSWNMIAQGEGCFLEKLNMRGGVVKVFGKDCKFMLPNEDQWEYACRGGKGNKRPFYWGDELNGTQANCNGDYPYGTTTKVPSLERTCAVDFTNGGKYEKHPWGLYHMIGNVYQWCDNVYDRSKEHNVLRGGSYGNGAVLCRSASRIGISPGFSSSAVYGFRVCLSLDK